MKSFVLSLLSLFLLVQPLAAQETKSEFKHDLSISLSTVQLAKKPFSVFLFNPRIMYRREIGNWAIRAQAQFLPTHKTEFLGPYLPAFQRSSSILVGM